MGCAQSTGMMTSTVNGVSYSCPAYSFSAFGTAIPYEVVGTNIDDLQYKLTVNPNTGIYASEPCGYSDPVTFIVTGSQGGIPDGSTETSAQGAQFTGIVPAATAGAIQYFVATTGVAAGQGGLADGGGYSALAIPGGTMIVIAGGGGGSASTLGGDAGIGLSGLNGNPGRPGNTRAGQGGTTEGPGAGGVALDGTVASSGTGNTGGNNYDPAAAGGGGGYYGGGAGSNDGTGGGGGSSFVDETVVTSYTSQLVNEPPSVVLFYKANGCVALAVPSTRVRARALSERRARRRFFKRFKHCPPSQRACPLASGDYECVDMDELTSCGGCASTGEGVDCSKLPGYRGVTCESDICVSTSSTCFPGFKLDDKKQCVRVNAQSSKARKELVFALSQ